MTEFQIRKDNFAQHRLVDVGSDQNLTPGEIRVKIDRFGYSANNITYAVMGDRLAYWQFFPPHGSDAEGWGILPVWGFADVVDSNIADVPVGDRLFGYFPPADHLTMEPVHVTERSFSDGASHRAELPSGYNLYRRVNAEPGYSRDGDNERMLLFPLHVTSFCLWDVLQDNEWYGAERVVILSASSKTSIGLAYALEDDENAPPVVGVTSSRNLGFVEGLGSYDDVCSYDDLTSLDPSIPTAIVDMSGNAEVLGALHKHLGDNMRKCVNVGLTHWDGARSDENIIAERSEFFFAPGHIAKRIKEWGPAGFDHKSGAFLIQAATKSRAWMKLQRLDGLDGLAHVHADMCAGNIAPDQGVIVEL